MERAEVTLLKMNENLLYCIIGIIGGGLLSFLISLLFYYMSIYNKCLLVDLVGPGHGSDPSHDFVFIMKNIGRATVEMTDFVKANKPMLSIDKIDSVVPISSSFPACVKAKIRKTKNRLYISFDYLKHGEQIVIVLLGDKSIERFYGTLRDGKIITYKSIMNFAKTKRVFSIPSIFLIECFVFCALYNVALIVIINLLIGIDIGLDLLYLWTFRKHIQNLKWIELVKSNK